MLFMLSTTHETLMRSLRDVHAAQLQVLEVKLQQAKMELLREQVESGQALDRVKLLTETVVSQQQTIKTAMSDLVILKGAGRVRTERDKPPELQELRPDVEITDAPADLTERRKLISDAAEEYERVLKAIAEEVDVSKVTPAAMAAATPKSREEWEEEHAPIPAPNFDDLIPSL